MKQAFHTLTVPTKGPGLYEFTDQARNFLRAEKIELFYARVATEFDTTGPASADG